MSRKNDSEMVCTIRWLSSYIESKKDLKRLEEQLEETKENIMPAARLNHEKSRVKRTTDLSDYQQEIERIEERIERERLTKIQNLKAIREKIESLKEQKEKDILTYRYIRGYPWEEVARAMGYDISWVFKVHKRAIAEISHKKPYKDVI